MAIFERALSKLTITAYKQHDDIKKNSSVGSFTAMYNPTQLDQTYSAVYSPNEAVSDATHGMRFERMGNGGLSLPLVFDGLLPGNLTSVTAQLSKLCRLCGGKDATSGETRYLKVTWGDQPWDGTRSFIGRFSSLTVTQEIFDSDGEPLRAKVKLDLVADNPIPTPASKGAKPPTGATPPIRRRIAVQRRSSPHGEWMGVRTQRAYEGERTWLANVQRSLVRVPQGCSLPSIASNTPGRESVDYLDLALTNGLVHLNDFEPGDSLLWPEQDV